MTKHCLNSSVRDTNSFSERNHANISQTLISSTFFEYMTYSSTVISRLEVEDSGISLGSWRRSKAWWFTALKVTTAGMSTFGGQDTIR